MLPIRPTTTSLKPMPASPPMSEGGACPRAGGPRLALTALTHSGSVRGARGEKSENRAAALTITN